MKFKINLIDVGRQKINQEYEQEAGDLDEIVVIRIDDSLFNKIVKHKNEHVHTWEDVLKTYLRVMGAK
jgi:hypothetical protein